ncbi:MULTISPECIES: sugar ABC transporter permease [Paenibacillus]|uniref:ABC transporter permease n=1 Tax=Paenibacillus TaxID=44249 RepID=UPI0007BFA948|nr:MULTISPECIES: ABC transporter permease subunit [Paenibacillus]MDR9743900.1 ABC transporter permease subunit [Paenibacillus taichungensis]MEC0106422.1 ABC transporter permease subunit [Paenibacillus taichungensis]MEC0197020.1 ABC transporter permease subunit [Paenibacillus taichungensis]WDQ35748.1 ABC transporter permease subunit [Paenibacillus marchantiae]
MGTRLGDAGRYLWRYRILYLLSVPGILYFFLFKYVPLFGSIIAFQNYNIFKGITGSDWVGLEHFQKMFSHYDFLRILNNTLLLGLYDLVIAFPVPILLAILLNEVRMIVFKRLLQTIVYMPHFLSWVVISGIFMGIFSMDAGVVNKALGFLGMQPIYFLGEDSYIRSILIGSGIWRDSGYGTIIFLAAIAGINPDLYEAAEVDGAGRLKQIWSITLPSLLPTIMILLLLHIGKFLDLGFERVFVFLNPLNLESGEILDTYIYKAGLLSQQYSYTTAIGLFKSVVGLMLVLLGNFFSKKTTGESLY